MLHIGLWKDEPPMERWKSFDLHKVTEKEYARKLSYSNIYYFPSDKF
jgi:hypothetical protein